MVNEWTVWLIGPYDHGNEPYDWSSYWLVDQSLICWSFINHMTDSIWLADWIWLTDRWWTMVNWCPLSVGGSFSTPRRVCWRSSWPSQVASGTPTHPAASCLMMQYDTINMFPHVQSSMYCIHLYPIVSYCIICIIYTSLCTDATWYCIISNDW